MLSNKRPLAFQKGNQFRIPAYKSNTHNPNKIYTVLRKDRGRFPQSPAEFVGIKNRKDWKYNFSNALLYGIFWCQ
jgi:hypothetical protein